MKSLYVDTDALEWRGTPYAGVRWKKLAFDKESGRSAVILQFEPGAAYGTHRHPGGEEYLVLEGSLEDGGRTYGAGSYVYHPPGSAHIVEKLIAFLVSGWLGQHAGHDRVSIFLGRKKQA